MKIALLATKGFMSRILGLTALATAWLFEHLNYWTVILFMAIESSFIPFPSEVVIPPAAWKSMSSPEMNLFLVIIAATIGSDIGALINYFLAKWLGKPVVCAFAKSRLGRLCLLSPESIEKAENYFRKHGAASTFFGRLIPAIRQLISIPAGLSEMKLAPFLLFTTLGAAAWNSVLAFLGYAVYKYSAVKTPKDVATYATRYSHEIGLIIAGIAIAAILFFLVRKQLKKK